MVKRFLVLSTVVLTAVVLTACGPSVEIQETSLDNGTSFIKAHDSGTSVGWSLGRFVYRNATQNFRVFTNNPTNVTLEPGDYIASANNTFVGSTRIILDGLYDDHVILGISREVGTSTGTFGATARNNKLELKLDQKVTIGHEYRIDIGSKIIEITLTSVKDSKATFKIQAIS